MILMSEKDVMELSDIGLYPSDYAYLVSIADEDMMGRVINKNSIVSELKALCKELNKEKLLPEKYKDLVTKWNGFEGVVPLEVVY